MSTRHRFRIVQVGLDCVPDSGGTHTLMHDVRCALDAPVISFTLSPLLQRQPVLEGVLHVPVSGGSLRQAYHWPRADQPGLAAAGRMLAAADLIIVHNLFRHHAYWAQRTARRNGTAYWVVPHGSLDPWVFSYRSVRKHLWMHAIGDRLVREANLVLFASPRESEKASQIIRDELKQAIVPWPVQPHPKIAGARTRIRAELRIPPDARVLLFVGRLHQDKHVLELIDAIGEIGDAGLHLILVGPDTPTLTARECMRAAAATAPGRVHVVGPVYGPERFAYLDAADGFVSLSHRESFGYAVAEAMAAGIPVIISQNTGLASSMQGVPCGWILSGSDQAEATAAIRRFLALDATALSNMGAAGRRWVEEELSYDRFASRLRHLAAITIDGTAVPAA